MTGIWYIGRPRYGKGLLIQLNEGGKPINLTIAIGTRGRSTFYMACYFFGKRIVILKDKDGWLVSR